MPLRLIAASYSKGNSAAQMQEWDSVLKAGRWYSTLPEPLRHALLLMASVKSLRHGKYLLRRGDDHKGLYAVLEGAARASAYNGTENKSSERIMMDLTPGNWFGETTLIDRQPSTHDIHAVGFTKLLYFSQNDLEKLLEVRPQYWRDFARLQSSKLRVIVQIKEELMCLPALSRLASRILEISTGFGWTAMPQTVQAGHKLKVSQADLAMMLGYSRQTVNNLLVELQQKNWLALHRGVIEILDPPALQREASGLGQIGNENAA